MNGLRHRGGRILTRRASGTDWSGIEKAVRTQAAKVDM